MKKLLTGREFLAFALLYLAFFSANAIAQVLPAPENQYLASITAAPDISGGYREVDGVASRLSIEFVGGEFRALWLLDSNDATGGQFELVGDWIQDAYRGRIFRRVSSDLSEVGVFSIRPEETEAPGGAGGATVRFRWSVQGVADTHTLGLNAP